MDATKTFPMLASIDVLVIGNGESCYVRRADMMPELEKRGLLYRFREQYTQRNRRYTPHGDYIAWDAEQTVYELLTEGHP